MSVIFRPLGKVREMVQSIGYDISYAYDDLVFADHSLFIIKFDDENPQNLQLFFNEDCDKLEAQKIEVQLLTEAQKAALNLYRMGAFSINQKTDAEELEITFLN